MSFRGTIEQWSTYRSPYDAPELPARIIGLFDGESIRTSRIAEVKGRCVRTASGSVYELGEPHPDFVKWVAKNNLPPIDPENPIKFVVVKRTQKQSQGT